MVWCFLEYLHILRLYKHATRFKEPKEPSAFASPLLHEVDTHKFENYSTLHAKWFDEDFFLEYRQILRSIKALFNWGQSIRAQGEVTKMYFLTHKDVLLVAQVIKKSIASAKYLTILIFIKALTFLHKSKQLTVLDKRKVVWHHSNKSWQPSKRIQELAS